MTVAGRYRRGACIAKGGSSTVHRASDLTSGAEVALKSFHVHRAFDPALLPSLEEGRAIASRVGPDVMVPILDVGADDDGTPFVIMPLVAGETLGARLERGAIGRGEALAVARGLLRSVDALHACGVTHGDLSPDNVLVREDGTPLLIDHEGLGAIGSPRPARATDGFGQRGGTREARDDHRALASIASVLVGAASEELDDARIDRFVAALREKRDDDVWSALGWVRQAGSAVSPRRFAALVACCVLAFLAFALLLSVAFR